MDIYTGDSVTLDVMASYWTINGQVNPTMPKIYSCNGLILLGVLTGFTTNDYIERIYPTPANHDIIYYSIRVLAANSWQSGDTITMNLDGTLVATWEPATIMAAEGQAICPDGTGAADDLLIFIGGKFFHTTSTLTVRLTSHITSGSTTASFAIRAVRMSLGHHKTTDAQGMCLMYNYRSTPSNCPCEYGSAEDPNNPGQCVGCASGTLVCYGPGADQGYGCVSGYTYDGNSCVPCPTGCQNCLGSNTSVCLQCNAAKILSWTNTCQTSCSNYLRQEGNYKFCDVCQPGYAQYPNGTCLPGCPAPWKETALVESHFCNYPCGSPTIYYHIKDSTCSSTCEYPYIVQDDVLCVLNLSEDETKQAQAISGGLGIGSQITGAASAVAGALSSGNPGAFCLATLSGMLRYIRYMKIKYPPKLQLILDQDSGDLFDIIPSMNQQMIDAFPQNTLPEKFEQYNLPSSFIVNFWDSGITLAILVFGALVISGLEIFAWRFKSVRPIIRNIRQTIRWNYCVMVFISHLEDIVLATSFELRTATFNSFLSVLSFLVCVVVNIIALGIFAKMVAVIWTLQKAKSTGSEVTWSKRLEIAKNKLKNFQVLFAECKEGNFLQQAEMCIFVLKVFLFYFVIAYFFDYPQVQTIFITILSLAMILYLVLMRPFKSRLNLIQNIVQEFIILIVNICTMILSFLDFAGVEATQSRQNLGEVVIDCYLAFSAFGVLCLFFNLGIIIYGIYQIIKKWAIKKTVAQNQKKVDSSDIKTESLTHRKRFFNTNKIKPADTSMNLELVSSMEPSNKDISISYLLNTSSDKSKALTFRGLATDNSILNNDLTVKEIKEVQQSRFSTPCSMRFGLEPKPNENGPKLSSISGLFSYRYVTPPNTEGLKENEMPVVEDHTSTGVSNTSIIARRPKAG